MRLEEACSGTAALKRCVCLCFLVIGYEEVVVRKKMLWFLFHPCCKVGRRSFGLSCHNYPMSLLTCFLFPPPCNS